MKKIIGTLFFIGLALSANAQLLWKVSGNGLEKPSYIFGTHHLASYSILEKVEGLMPAFDETSQVVGELKMSDMQSSAAMQIMQQQMMMTGDQTIKGLFTEDEYNMVNKFVKENMQFDLAMMPKLKPAFITNNIVLLLYMKNVKGYNPQEQLDTYFQTKAQEKGKEVAALETMEFQVNLLFNSTPVERQAEVLACTLSDVDKTLSDTQKLADAYMAQDLKTILELATKKDGTKCDPLPGELEALTDNRNVIWMEKLPGMMKEQPTFVAVGALHLVGKKGLINLFKEAGYTIEPVK
ncbi:TraB/GumN family protein [Bacteroides sp. 51]|uniref:TraB/GumN family protein n=1 Tax=Bacteroides sp. 51 TaxID=2302938 RepID=UPI0013D132E3|nr:TraB/GumN family protein [Bacteroides sp. 51]NDV84067.1 TraB/GumN family protein [Bacteroides sp. 51]